MNIGRIIEVGKRELAEDRLRDLLRRADRALQERSVTPRNDDSQPAKQPLQAPQRRKV